ncbi:LOW QUALITY PROTEIN: tRNA (adenine(37)-N6)-methyltransferase [Coregonus clupeaformis]|uniref:LOW QUALITY PROTEIN: tRNA (adenine(37)-N6)-methyltransferase n=1 Tax=Coregonus clupeaformis TaxID=59861 RepID=UPI001E1C49DF|nr:LOW QUALITY PROTEIN: tRNA (adenine(37)-N6)-methyltransferase [Coregonus clupeaformis]
MSASCNCTEHVNKLHQQISVMRKEIKNLRQLLDSAVRSHRKHMTSLQSALTHLGQSRSPKSQLRPQADIETQNSLEKGTIQTVPIGYISSCFSVKNGTPRQPTICGPSRATLQIQQSVFNNPEHSLVGLDNYSHVWVVFLFHKNGHLSYKAKVKPPRLNGQRVGVYSTRSPHRPNALGLTLAKLDRVTDDTLHLSEIDMIAGTPVLDIKPYISDYDSPHSRLDIDTDTYDCGVQPEGTNVPSEEGTTSVERLHSDSIASFSCTDDPQLDLGVERGNSHSTDPRILHSKDKSKVHIHRPGDASSSSAPKAPFKDLTTVLGELKAYISQGDDHLTLGSSVGKSQASDGPKTKPLEPVEDSARPCYGQEAYSTIAGWIREPPVTNLEVRFTPHAERELDEFLAPINAEPRDRTQVTGSFAVKGCGRHQRVLSADPSQAASGEHMEGCRGPPPKEMPPHTMADPPPDRVVLEDALQAAERSLHGVSRLYVCPRAQCEPAFISDFILKALDYDLNCVEKHAVAWFPFVAAQEGNGPINDLLLKAMKKMRSEH